MRLFGQSKFVSVACSLVAAMGFSFSIAGCGGGGGDAGGSSSTPAAAPATSSSPAESEPAESEPASSAESTTETTSTEPAEKTDAPAEGGVGTLTGRVVLEGQYTPLAPLHAAGADGVKDAAVCAKHEVPNESLLVNVDEGNGVANVFVYLSRAPKGYKAPAAPTEAVVMDQKGCVFLPHALIVRAGQPILVKSDDEVAHNVHTFPAFQQAFNQICQPKERTGLELLYEKGEPEPVQVKCDIHPWMQAFHLPVEHPFAALTDASGNFRIEGLPSGTHKFRVWHEKGGAVEKSLKVEITADQETEMTITIKAEQLAQNNQPVKTIVLARNK